jgi:gliding motility-associated-like protein
MAGNYVVTVTAQNGCVVSDTIPVRIFPRPSARLISSANKQCVPFCSNLTLLTDSGRATVKSFSFQVTKQITSINSSSYCFNSAGQFPFNVSFVDTNNCAGDTSFIIIAYEKPNANFEFSPPNPLAGVDKVHFYDFTTGLALDDWRWYLEGNDSLYVSDRNAEHIFTAPGKYPIVFQVRNKWGCLDTIIKVLVVEEDFTLFVPNAFTVNDDNLNDVFIPKGKGVAKFQMDIFDRWGLHIFHSDDFTVGWNGFYKGERCTADSYVWKIYVVDFAGKSRSLTGHVVLVR